MAKNCLIITLMSLELGYGSILERYQQERNMSSPVLSSVILTDEELSIRVRMNLLRLTVNQKLPQQQCLRPHD